MANVSSLIDAPQYAMPFGEKQQRLLPLLESQVASCSEHIPAYRRYLEKSAWTSAGFAEYGEVPYLPVSVFKHFDLCAVPAAQVARVLQSSATTTGTPSKIYLDKATSFRQARALAAIVMEEVGRSKRPYLVLDTEEINRSGPSLSARGAAFRGFLPFASSATFGLTSESGSLRPSIPQMEQFFEQHAGKPVLLSGFTYIVWSQVVSALKARGVRFQHPNMILFHSGGWKRLREMRVEKEAFNAGVCEVFGCPPTAVRDFYGLVEQVGVIFVDCPAGHKHTPNFAEVVVRNFHDLRPAPPGGSGLIEVLSVLPSSYPGQALLTEDVGQVLGYDDCPCGRAGLHFRFQSRVEKAEVRGCGDTFAMSQSLSAVSTKDAAPSRQASSHELEILAGQSPAPAAPEVDAVGPAALASLRATLLRNAEEAATIPSGAIVALLDAAGKNMVASEYGAVEGIAFLSSWLRQLSMNRVLAVNFGSSLPALDAPWENAGQRLRAAPAGLVCHWVAGNVPTLAMFSWAMAALAKNASIVRVSQDSREIARLLFQAVQHAEASFEGKPYRGESLMARTSVIHFPSTDQAMNHAMSLAADVRVIWGGSEAVRAVTQYPRMEHCEDLIFGPKYSVALMDAAAVRDPDFSAEAIRALVRDTVLFEQGACSSPQVLYVEAGEEECERLADRLAEAFREASRRFPKRGGDPFQASQIVNARANYGLKEGTSLRMSKDLSYTLLLERGAVLRDAIQGRTLFVVAVEDLREAVALFSPKIQTIGMAVANPARRAALAEQAALRGVARSVQPGSMNLYESPWDGMLPVNRLVRWCKV